MKLPSKSKRRTPAQLRHDILAAAQEVFSEKGYAAASVREIAKRADAATPLIFRHFENKATLFATAVFEPIEKTLDESLSKADPYWVNLSPSERVRNYAELVIGTFRSNKRLFIAYLNAIVFHADEFQHLGEKLAPASFESRIDQLERFSLEHPAGVQFLLSDPHFEVRLILLLFYSVALFDELFFDPSERDLAREMRGVVKLVSMGIGLGIPDGDLRAKAVDPRTLATEAVPEGDELQLLVHLQDRMNRMFDDIYRNYDLTDRRRRKPKMRAAKAPIAGSRSSGTSKSARSTTRK
jgi:AcrR family transcriptional regulator